MSNLDNNEFFEQVRRERTATEPDCEKCAELTQKLLATEAALKLVTTPATIEHIVLTRPKV